MLLATPPPAPPAAPAPTVRTPPVVDLRRTGGGGTGVMDRRRRASSGCRSATSDGAFHPSKSAFQTCTSASLSVPKILSSRRLRENGPVWAPSTARYQSISSPGSGGGALPFRLTGGEAAIGALGSKRAAAGKLASLPRTAARGATMVSPSPS